MNKIFGKLNRFFQGAWQIAVLDLQKGRWLVEAKKKNIAYLKAENAKGNHILIRPPPETEPFFMLADDLNRRLLKRQHKQNNIWRSGRMVIETSPGNFQVWIRSSRALTLAEKRYWLQRMHSDPGADPNHRWGRCPGFRNRKKKHKAIPGGYPLARLIWVDWQHSVVIPPSAGNKDIHDPAKPRSLSPLPRGVVCHYKNKTDITRQDYEQGDESATDFAYALALARRNYSEQQIVNRILTERQNWQNHQGKIRMNSYICRTVAKAVDIVSNSTK